VFRYINAEKTVGGAKEFKKPLNRGSPIFEVKDESIRSSLNPSLANTSLMNSEYYQHKQQQRETKLSSQNPG